MVFADSVAFPFRVGFAKVYRRFAEAGLTDDMTFIGAGKLGIPENALVAFALGCDMVNVGREAMLSIGCIQAQKCHTDECPAGVATQQARSCAGSTRPQERPRRQLRQDPAPRPAQGLRGRRRRPPRPDHRRRHRPDRRTAVVAPAARGLRLRPDVAAPRPASWPSEITAIMAPRARTRDSGRALR